MSKIYFPYSVSVKGKFFSLIGLAWEISFFIKFFVFTKIFYLIYSTSFFMTIFFISTYDYVANFVNNLFYLGRFIYWAWDELLKSGD